MARFRTSINRNGPAVAASDGYVAVFQHDNGMKFRERAVLIVRERSIVPLVLDDDGLGFSRASDYPNFIRLEEL